ncbi:uncharacterized protein [Elaeis guineensis]|uniref:uncharacterized protein isoform X2 n=1 Tax=Elaeis guineensis var. tenera TaxID=51953 RepID=UPI00057A789C
MLYRWRSASCLLGVVHKSLLHGDAKAMSGGDTLNEDLSYISFRKVTRAAEALQSHSKRSRKHRSMRQHEKCETFDLPKEFYKARRCHHQDSNPAPLIS